MGSVPSKFDCLVYNFTLTSKEPDTDFVKPVNCILHRATIDSLIHPKNSIFTFLLKAYDPIRTASLSVEETSKAFYHL